MKKTKTIETIAVILISIGFLSFLSQKFFYIDVLKNAYGLGDFFQVVGLLMMAIIYFKKKKAK